MPAYLNAVLPVAASLLFMAGHPEIAVRHDVDDAEFLALGQQFPATVRIGDPGGTGTFIGDRWVLTAGHVAHGMARRSPDGVRVFPVGHADGILADKIILHPDFEPMGAYDLALIRLSEPVADAETARLYRDRDEAGQIVYLAGFGDTKTGLDRAWDRDGELRGATNHVDDVTETHILFDFDDPREPTGELTDLEGTSGPGDSGGPAYITADGAVFVAGVSSLGRDGGLGPGTYGAQEFYVRVSSHAEWLDRMMSEPPPGDRVNFPEETSAARPGVRRRVGPGGGQPGQPGQLGRPGGQMPDGVHRLGSIGMLVADQDGVVRMVGRIDQLYPRTLLDGGVRPPARLVTFNERPIEAASSLQEWFDDLDDGSSFTLGVQLSPGADPVVFALRK